MTHSHFCYTLLRLKNFLLIFVILITCSNLLHAQSTQFYSQNYLESSISIQKSGMIVLGSWALLNIFSGVPASLTFDNNSKYFFQMNAAWNIVNLGIASIGYIGAIKGYDLKEEVEILKEMQNFDRILLINAGLDLAYIGAGAWLWNKGLKDKSTRLNGYGKSLVLQGSFLLLFDSFLYLIHHQKTNEFLFLNGQISLTGNGISFAF